LATTTPCTGSASPANVLDLKYNFSLGAGDNGNLLGFTNDKDSNRSVAYTYDALNRLASAATPNADCSLVTGTSLTKNWGESFTIDAWGNLTGKTVTKCSAETLSVGPATNLNQLPSGSGFGYDAAGDMTSNGGATYTYNAEGQLKTAGGVTYTYDGDGNRVKKSSGTEYWGAGPMLESNGSGTLQREFIFAGGKRIARRDISGGAVYYYFTDDLGSSSVVTTAAGVIDNESDYYPYGGERVYTATLANQNYKFTGKERDTESGLDNFGARYDSSTLGRFMTPDWAARPTTVPYAVFGDPQSLNLYGYVRNDPVSQVDADGHDSQQTEVPGNDTPDFPTNANGRGNRPQTVTSPRLKTQQKKPTAQDLAAQVPGDVKTAIMNSVNASNAPSGADTKGGFHEEGGIAGTNASGGSVISPAVPGAYSPSGKVQTNLMPADPALNASMTNVTVSWHVHPSGRTASGDLAWNQPPSGQDQKVAATEHQAVPSLIHIAVGAGNKQVYFYNGSSTVLQMSLKKFMGPQ
jgi:RHS repeat-associated protein